MVTAMIAVTVPKIWNGLSKTYLPMELVPERSMEQAAMAGPLIGNKKPLTAGNMAISANGDKPSANPIGMIARVVAA